MAPPSPLPPSSARTPPLRGAAAANSQGAPVDELMCRQWLPCLEPPPPAAPKPHIGQLLPPHAGRPGRMCGFKPPARAKQTHDALGPLSPAGAFGRLRRPSSAPTHPPSTTALLGHPGRCACRLKGLLVGGSRRPSSSMIAVLLKPLRLPSQEHSLASVAMLFPARPMFSAHRPLVDEGVKGRLAWPACWPNVVTPSCHRRHCCWLAGAAQRRAACRSARTGCL